MQEIKIDVARVEELQMINDRTELDRLFARCQSMVVQGGSVLLTRTQRDGRVDIFDSITTENDLKAYKETVYRHLR